MAQPKKRRKNAEIDFNELKMYDPLNDLLADGLFSQNKTTDWSPDDHVGNDGSADHGYTSDI
ncbi:MAG: hypothetical protein M1836_003424 [Candelina mexicana]|nr:MAG: hypothetical protein M1836_003424 [Candelina mexicana]